MNAFQHPLTSSYRSVFVSDTHLGTRGCRSDFLAHFLGAMTCQNLFLVGDIVDGWRLRKSWYWDQSHDDVVRHILRHASAGSKVVYIPGNHDEIFRAWLPHRLEFHGVRLLGEAEHVTSDGKRLLVIHGDQFDSVVRYAKIVALFGDWAYTAALNLNRWFNVIRRSMGYPYWSFSRWAKQRVKQAVKFIDRFETTLAAEAKRRNFDGVVCGHIHHAEMRQIDGILYLNTGDWVESCTALVEHHDGTFELIEWAKLNELSFFSPREALARETA